MAAHGLVDALDNVLATIGRHPESGSPRFGEVLVVPGLRSWVIPGYPYLVFYLVSGRQVHVWRVLHSARDIPQSLRRDEPVADPGQGSPS